MCDSELQLSLIAAMPNPKIICEKVRGLAAYL